MDPRANFGSALSVKLEMEGKERNPIFFFNFSKASKFLILITQFIQSFKNLDWFLQNKDPKTSQKCYWSQWLPLIVIVTRKSLKNWNGVQNWAKIKQSTEKLWRTLNSADSSFYKCHILTFLLVNTYFTLFCFGGVDGDHIEVICGNRWWWKELFWWNGARLPVVPVPRANQLFNIDYYLLLLIIIIDYHWL